MPSPYGRELDAEQDIEPEQNSTEPEQWNGVTQEEIPIPTYMSPIQFLMA